MTQKLFWVFQTASSFTISLCKHNTLENSIFPAELTQNLNNLNHLLPSSIQQTAMRVIVNHMTINEPRHDKTNIMRLRPAWIQTSLRIRTV
jgi:hypothetical protein